MVCRRANSLGARLKPASPASISSSSTRNMRLVPFGFACGLAVFHLLAVRNVDAAPLATNSGVSSILS